MSWTVLESWGGFFWSYFDRVHISNEFRLLIFTGFFGGFTTFSTLAFETVTLAEGSQMLRAAANVAAHVILGLSAAWIGYHGARLL